MVEDVPVSPEQTTSPSVEKTGEPVSPVQTTEGTSAQGSSTTYRKPTPDEVFDVHAERVERFIKSADAKAWNLVRQEDIAAHNEEINSNLGRARQYIDGLENLVGARSEYSHKWSDVQHYIGSVDSTQDMAEEFNFDLETEAQARAASGKTDEQAILEKDAARDDALRVAVEEETRETIRLLVAQGLQEEADKVSIFLEIYIMQADAELDWEANQAIKAEEEAELYALLAAEKEGLDSLNDPAIVNA